MTDDRADHLSPEDRIVWDTVRRTARPLRLVDAPLSHFEYENFSQYLANNFQKTQIQETQIKADNTVKKPPVKNAAPNLLDRKTHRKISRGTIAIDARIDLHGLTQVRAHSLLLNFIQMAASRGSRHVLVITGKGKSFGSDGILRQAVPQWLSTAPFRLYVSAYEDAARHHGGQGALYLRLRRHGGI